MGTWSTPNTMAKANKLAKLLAKPLPGEKATDVLYDLVGDDDLFDNIDRQSSDVRRLVADKLEKWDSSYHAHPDSWFVTITPAMWVVLRRAYKKVLARRSR